MAVNSERGRVIFLIVTVKRESENLCCGNTTSIRRLQNLFRSFIDTTTILECAFTFLKLWDVNSNRGRGEDFRRSFSFYLEGGRYRRNPSSRNGLYLIMTPYVLLGPRIRHPRIQLRHRLLRRLRRPSRNRLSPVKASRASEHRQLLPLLSFPPTPLYPPPLRRRHRRGWEVRPRPQQGVRREGEEEGKGDGR